MEMNALALILARAGSKGLPGKNLRPVAGRPCIAWTFDHALAARHRGTIDRVALTSDSDEMLRLAVESGIDAVARPPELASDSATVDDAARHAVESIERESPDAKRYDAVVILYGNVPVRPDRLIDRSLDLLRNHGADSVQSYAPVGKNHPWWTAVVEDDGRVRAFDHGELNHGVHRRQDLPPAHIPDGGIIAVTRRALFRMIAGVPPGPHAFLGADRRGIINVAGAVIDIDSQIDLLVADAILREQAGLLLQTES